MKKTLLSFVLATLLLPQVASADGGVFIDYEKSVYLPSQKAAIAWEEDTETLILSTRISIKDLANIAWVIPIPSKTKPEIEVGDVDIFYDLTRLFEQGKRAPGLWLGKSGDEVEVIEIKKVDIYDIAILKATGAEVLVDWLNKNGYVIPTTATPILQEYCAQDDFYFLANKINLANKYKDLETTEGDKVCARGVSESIVAYRKLSDAEIAQAMSGLTACEKANFEAVKALVELEKGVATPLEITFSPETLFYPLKMSSINEGDTVIDVYVFSDQPVQDTSQLLTLSQMTENTASFEESYNLNQKYVTYLSFSGELGDLTGDSWFESRGYDRSLDPNYVSLGGRIVEILNIVLTFALYVAYPTILIAVLGSAVIGFVVVLRAIVNWFKRRRKK